MRARPDIGAIVHCRPTYATVLSILKRPIPASHEMIAAFGGPTIRCADYAPYGTREFAELAVGALADRSGALIGNHGLVAIGADLSEAMRRATALETLARLYYLALAAGRPATFSGRRRLADHRGFAERRGPQRACQDRQETAAQEGAFAEAGDERQIRQRPRREGGRSNIVGAPKVTRLARREWVPAFCEDYSQEIAARIADQGVDEIDAAIHALIAENRATYEDECVNLNPAGNAMNPRAEAAMAAGLSSRPSLGYPGDKYEMGLEAVEKIEIIAAELAAEIFRARYAEVRVGSGALANLYAFMATAKPGERIIAPPAEIAGHVTHHQKAARPAFMGSRSWKRRSTRRKLHGRCRRAAFACASDAGEAHHDRRQPQSVSPSAARNTGDRGRDRRKSTFRRRAYLRHDRRRRMAQSAR